MKRLKSEWEVSVKRLNPLKKRVQKRNPLKRGLML